MLHQLSDVFGIDRRMLKKLRSDIREHPEVNILEALKVDGYGTLPDYFFIEHDVLHSWEQWKGKTIQTMPIYYRFASRLNAHGDIIEVFPVARRQDFVITTCGMNGPGVTQEEVIGKPVYICDLKTFERRYQK